MKKAGITENFKFDSYEGNVNQRNLPFEK